MDKEALRQKDRKRKETGRTMGDRSRGENDREHNTLSEKDRDREQDKVIQREKKGTGRQDKVKDGQK